MTLCPSLGWTIFPEAIGKYICFAFGHCWRGPFSEYAIQPCHFGSSERRSYGLSPTQYVYIKSLSQTYFTCRTSRISHVHLEETTFSERYRNQGYKGHCNICVPLGAKIFERYEMNGFSLVCVVLGAWLMHECHASRLAKEASGCKTHFRSFNYCGKRKVIRGLGD